MTYGFIIAAGNQTRFNSDIPKVLSKLKDKTCLDYTIKSMSSICDKIYVVCSNKKESYFKNYDHIAIDSGDGCGDAVLKALEYIDFNEDDTCYIQWGDSINESRIYSIIKSHFNNISDICVPYKIENQPYVKLNLYNNIIKSVQFSKFDEVSESGAHDLSVFYGNANSIKKYCREFKKKFFNDDKYIHKHGNEFNFLDLFNDTNILNNAFELNDIKSYSFNSKEEYDNIIKYIDSFE